MSPLLELYVILGPKNFTSLMWKVIPFTAKVLFFLIIILFLTLEVFY